MVLKRELATLDCILTDWRKSLLFLLLPGLVFVFGLASPVEAQEQKGQAYIVQRDDTLWKIAEKYFGDGHQFANIVMATRTKHSEDSSFARLDDPDLIVAGTKLWIPASGTFTPAVTGADVASAGPVESSQPAARPAGEPGSPSGQIAFSFWNNSPERCTYEINVIDVQACLTGPEACQASRRIFALNNASEPALSPDGQRLAFRGWGAIPEEYGENQIDHPYYGCPGPHAERRLGITNLDATEYVPSAAFWEDSHPDWSPDGQRLLFDTRRVGDGITRIMAISADGSYEETLRIAGQHPSWAPDSDRFVYRGCDLTGNRCGLWVARALPVEAWDLGLNLVGPVLEEAEAAHPDWSPVGEQIVYQSPVSGSWDLYAIDSSGANKRQLTDTPGIEGLPAWSPNGQWIAYLSDEGGNWGIWIIRADGSEQRRLFSFDGGIFTPLAITPYFQRDWLDEQISWSR